MTGDLLHKITFQDLLSLTLSYSLLFKYHISYLLVVSSTLSYSLLLSLTLLHKITFLHLLSLTLSYSLFYRRSSLTGEPPRSAFFPFLILISQLVRLQINVG